MWMCVCVVCTHVRVLCVHMCVCCVYTCACVVCTHVRVLCVHMCVCCVYTCVYVLCVHMCVCCVCVVCMCCVYTCVYVSVFMFVCVKTMYLYLHYHFCNKRPHLAYPNEVLHSSIGLLRKTLIVLTLPRWFYYCAYNILMCSNIYRSWTILRAVYWEDMLC